MPVEERADRGLVGHVDLRLDDALDRLAAGHRPAPGGDDLGALRRPRRAPWRGPCRSCRRRPRPAGPRASRRDLQDGLAAHAPAQQRVRRLAARSQVPRQPTCGSSRPAASSATRWARSSPIPAPTTNVSIRVPPARSRAASKSIVVGSSDAMPMLSTSPPGRSSACTSASIGPPTLSSAASTGSPTSSRPTTHLGRAELRQALGARRTPDRGDDVRAGVRGQLHGEAPDAARRAGDQHAPPGDRRRAVAARATRSRRRRGARPRRRGRRRRARRRARRCRPRAARAQPPDEPNVATRAPAGGPEPSVGRGPDRAGGVEARHVAGREAPAQERHVGEVERGRADLDQRLGRPRDRGRGPRRGAGRGGRRDRGGALASGGSDGAPRPFPCPRPLGITDGYGRAPARPPVLPRGRHASCTSRAPRRRCTSASPPSPSRSARWSGSSASRCSSATAARSG